MRLTIHRGTHEIGGSCVQLFSDSTDTRFILDLGMPLVKSDRTQFEWRDHKGKSIHQLIDSGILPAIEDLYESNQSPAATLESQLSLVCSVCLLSLLLRYLSTGII